MYPKHHTRRSFIKNTLKIALLVSASLYGFTPAIASLDVSTHTAFQDFLIVCSHLTQEPKRNLSFSYPAFKSVHKEPWGKEHIQSCAEKIKNNNNDFTDGEQWFLGHVLTTLYLGVYYHQDMPTKRVLYDDAMMFRATQDIAPTPFIQALGQNAWTTKPLAQ